MKLIKMEKRFKPGEYFRFMYDADKPVKLLKSSDECGDCVAVNSSDTDARNAVYSDLVNTIYHRSTKAKFKADLDTLLRIMMESESRYETFLVFDALTHTSHNGVNPIICMLILKSKSFRQFRDFLNCGSCCTIHMDETDLKMHTEISRKYDSDHIFNMAETEFPEWFKEKSNT